MVGEGAQSGRILCSTGIGITALFNRNIHCDSWIFVDFVSTAERESLLTHLSTLLPNVVAINKGEDGKRVLDLLARFESDVVPYNPNVIIVHTATSNAYNPASSVFDPIAINVYDKKMRMLMNTTLLLCQQFRPSCAIDFAKKCHIRLLDMTLVFLIGESRLKGSFYVS